ncbi:hypothetical protein [Herpetosiphon gulosus]|uniref:Uncharacterized protein n=1 Tax=Herpetosiphon gulosus TaxID=1973496 RepID=A0ABP9WYA8_9CHLR
MTTQQQIDYASIAKAQYDATIESLKQSFPDVNKNAPEKLAASSTTTATGSATFATAFIYGTCTCDLTFDNGQKTHFYGTMWGIGLGGGTSAGAYIGVPANQLVGDCSFQVTVVSGVAGAVTIQFWRGNDYLGNFTGAALAVAASVTGGSGEWTMK